MTLSDISKPYTTETMLGALRKALRPTDGEVHRLPVPVPGDNAG